VTEISEERQKEILEQFRSKLRDISARVLTRIPPADLAGVLLVQSLAIMNLERDDTACAAWLRDLATGIETLGVEAVTSPKDMN
jgi:hypothetical protein